MYRVFLSMIAVLVLMFIIGATGCGDSHDTTIVQNPCVFKQVGTNMVYECPGQPPLVVHNPSSDCRVR